MIEKLRDEVAALERELARQEALADGGNEGSPFPRPEAAVALDGSSCERAEEEEEEHEEREEHHVDEEEDGDEEDDGDEDGENEDEEGGGDVLTGMRESTILGGHSRKDELPLPALSRRKVSDPAVSVRMDPPFSFESRCVLKRRFGRLRDLKSPLELDLDGASSRHDDSQGSLAHFRIEGSSGNVRKKMADIKQDSFHSFTGSFTRKGATNRAAARERLPSNGKDDSDSIEDGFSVISHDDVEAGASAGKPRSSVFGRLLYSKSIRKRKPSGSVASALSLASAREEEEEEEETQEMKGAFSIRVYLKSAAVLALWLTDVILFIILEIIWIDSVCTSDGYSDPMEAAPAGADEVLGEVGLADVHYRLRWEIISLKSAILCCYFLKIYTVFGKTYRIQNVKSIFGRPLLSLWTFLLVLTACVGILIAEVVECASSDAIFFARQNVENMQRAKVSLHLLRIIFAWSLLIYRLKKTFRRKMQTAVSQNRRRFLDPDGDFDLDLTYICDRLIAMSLPCVEGVFYRNDIRDVAKFFANHHYGSFCVVNCCEAQEESGNGNYDPAALYSQVKKYPMRDHNICPLRTLVLYCEHATKFLNESEENVIAVHCQGGKGRTGSFCSSLMLWTGLFSTSGEALGYFARRRTDASLGNFKSPIAVTSPSQKRFVGYLEDVMKLSVDYISHRRLLLTRLTIFGQPLSDEDSCNFTFIIEHGTNIEYDHGKAQGLVSMTAGLQGAMWSVTLAPPVLVTKDVNIRFYRFEPGLAPGAIVGHSAVVAPGGRAISYGSHTGKQLMFVQYHTAWATDKMSFLKSELDGAYNKRNAVFAEDFSLTIEMDVCATKKDHASAEADDVEWNSDSSRQHLNYLSLSHQHRLAYSCHHLCRVMKRLCRRSHVFKRGDAIFNPIHHTNRRCLYYIEKGNVILLPRAKGSRGARVNRCEFEKVSCRKTGGPAPGPELDPYKGTTTVGPDVVWGAGQFLDVGKFVLASDTTALSGAVAYAYSDSVTMRIWHSNDPHQSSRKIGGSAGRSKKSVTGTLSGMKFDGMTIHDLDLLYEMLAHQAVNLSIVADTTALARSSMLESMKRSSNKLIDWKTDMIKSGRSSLSIPMTEALIFKAEARLVSDEIVASLRKTPSDLSKFGRTESASTAKVALRGRTSPPRAGSLTSDHAPPPGALTSGKSDSGHDAAALGSMNLRRKYNFAEEPDKEHSLVCVFRQRVVLLDAHKTAIAHHVDDIQSARTESNLLILQLKGGQDGSPGSRQKSPPPPDSPSPSPSSQGFWSGTFSASFVGRSRSISPQRSFKNQKNNSSWRKISALTQTSSKAMQEVDEGQSDGRCKSFSPPRNPKRQSNISQDKITSPYDVDQKEPGGKREGRGGAAGHSFISPRGKWLRTSSVGGSNDEAGDGDTEANLGEGGKGELKIVFREPASALAACREVSRLVSNPSATARENIVAGLHPLAIKFGLVDIDQVSGEVNDSLTQDEARDIATFLDASPQTVYNKDQVISAQGVVSHTIFCVSEGSVSARNAQGDVLVRRGQREMFGEWSFFGTGNKGAGASIVADEDSTTVLEFSKASLDRIRLTCPHVSARVHRFIASTMSARTNAQLATQMNKD